MENKWKFYIIILVVVLSLVLYKKVYIHYYNKTENYKLKIKQFNILNQKFKQKINTLPKLKAQLKIEEKKLKNIKNRLLKGHNPNEILENLQKYLFDYFQKQDININNYRQLRLIEAKYFYKCRFEINTVMNFEELIKVFEFIDNSNYLIKIPEINIYYTRRNRQNKIRVRIIFETIFIKEEFNDIKI